MNKADNFLKQSEKASHDSMVHRRNLLDMANKMNLKVEIVGDEAIIHVPATLGMRERTKIIETFEKHRPR